jgi:hypothetical protein
MKKPKMVKLTFEELVAQATLGIHSALLEGGGYSMKSAIHTWMAHAIEWSRRDEKVEVRGKK